MMIALGSFHISVMLADYGLLCTSHLIATSENDVCTLQSIHANIVRCLRLKRGVRLLRGSFYI